MLMTKDIISKDKGHHTIYALQAAVRLPGKYLPLTIGRKYYESSY